MTDPIKSKVLKKIESLKKKNGIYLFISSAGYYNIINSTILSYYTKTEKKAGIYVTLNKGFKPMSASLNEEGVDVSRLYFIDGITRTENSEIKDKNCTFISSPHALTELSLAITTATNTGIFDFLFFDSINTLLIYNDLKTTQKFAHYVITKMREANLGGIIFSLDEESGKNVIPAITQFCDDCIKF